MIANFNVLEFSFGEVPQREEVIDLPKSLEPGGFLALSERPGFGVTLNEKTLARYKEKAPVQ